jgi:hypothetical protein
MKRTIAVIGCITAAALILSACGKDTASQPSTANQTPAVAPVAAAPASSPVPEAAAPPPPAPPPIHEYAMVDNGTYGYEPALSEDDVRNGTATKPLIMMRYAGNEGGTYVIIILGHDASDASVTTRMSCQVPCEFAKSELMSGDSVIKTETLRVTSDSLMGAMLADAVSGQLIPYGQTSSGGQIVVPTQSVRTSQQAAPQVIAPQMPQQTQPVASRSPQMWIGSRDTNLRTCPGVGCAALIVIPKGSGVSVDMSSAQKPPQSNDSWVRVTYSGPYCSPGTLDQKVGCVAPIQSSNPVTGWLDYSLLSQSPQPVTNAAPAASTSDQSASTYPNI